MSHRIARSIHRGIALAVVLLVVVPSRAAVIVVDDDAPPGGTGGRYATLQLLNGVALQGGDADLWAPDPYERDIAAHETILSGDIRVMGDMGDNSQHVADFDTDADQDDFAVFQRCYSGEDIPANPHCAE